MPSTELATLDDEQAMVAALRRGDEHVFTAIFDAYTPALVQVAMDYVASRAVAEEVVQETWIKAIGALDGFEGRSTLKHWIFRILRYTAINRGERERRTVPFAALAREESEGDFPAVDPDRFVREGDAIGAWAAPPVRWWEEPERALDSSEAVARIEAEIEKLPEMQRLVITMRDVLGMSSEDVRSALDISETNQRVLLHRARSKVRAGLEDYYANA